MPYGKNVQTVLDILKNEVHGDVGQALGKMAADYSMTWMYKKGETLFPSTGIDVEHELEEVYPIKGREYDIRNIAEGENVVMIEVVESYPDPETGKVYRTPQVIVLEIENGKIRKGRHYCDPDLSFLHLTQKQVDVGFKGTETKVKIS